MTTTEAALALRDSLRKLADEAVDRDGFGPEVFAIQAAYHALAKQFGYPEDVE